MEEEEVHGVLSLFIYMDVVRGMFLTHLSLLSLH